MEKLPICAPEKLLQKQDNSKGNIQNCHVAINPVVQLHQSNLLKNLQISFHQKFLAFHLLLCWRCFSTSYRSPWSPRKHSSSGTPQCSDYPLIIMKNRPTGGESSGSFPVPCLEHLQAFLGVFQSFRLTPGRPRKISTKSP